jgi:hypothetical protein
MTAFPPIDELSDPDVLEETFQGAIGDFLSAVLELPGAKATDILTIAAGIVAPTTGSMIVDTEAAAASDDLTNIVPVGISTWDGRHAWLRIADPARVVVLKHLAGGFGQIRLKRGADLTLDRTNAWVVFRYDHASGVWEEVLSDSFLRVPSAVKNATFTVGRGDHGKIFYCTGTYTVNFEAAATLGPDFYCWIENEGSGTLTLDANGAELINGAATMAVPAGTSVRVSSTGTALKASRKIAGIASISTTLTQTDATSSVTPDALAAYHQKGADIASAATLVRPSDANVGGFHVITGNVNISNLWNNEPGTRGFWAKFTGTLTIFNGTNLKCPNNENLSIKPNDYVFFYHTGGGVWEIVSRTDNRRITISSSAPSGGNDNDIWLQY